MARESLPDHLLKSTLLRMPERKINGARNEDYAKKLASESYSYSISMGDFFTNLSLVV